MGIQQKLAAMVGLVITLIAVTDEVSASPSFVMCKSETLGIIRVYMKFREWIDDDGNTGGAAEFGNSENSYILDYKGKPAELIYRRDKSKLILSDGSVIKMDCNDGW